MYFEGVFDDGDGAELRGNCGIDEESFEGVFIGLCQASASEVKRLVSHVLVRLFDDH